MQRPIPAAVLPWRRASGAGHRFRGRGFKGKKKANKGARGMPVALGGEEGRDKLRKAAVRGKCPVTRGCPNGETRQERSWHRDQVAGRTRGTETS